MLNCATPSCKSSKQHQMTDCMSCQSWLDSCTLARHCTATWGVLIVHALVVQQPQGFGTALTLCNGISQANNCKCSTTSKYELRKARLEVYRLVMWWWSEIVVAKGAAPADMFLSVPSGGIRAGRCTRPMLFGTGACMRCLQCCSRQSGGATG